MAGVHKLLKHESMQQSITHTVPQVNECVICYDDEIPEGTFTYVVEPCHHSFEMHEKCMNNFKQNHSSCMSCRKSIKNTFKIFKQT